MSLNPPNTNGKACAGRPTQHVDVKPNFIYLNYFNYTFVKLKKKSVLNTVVAALITSACTVILAHLQDTTIHRLHFIIQLHQCLTLMA